MKLTYRENKRPIDENGDEHKLCFGDFTPKIHSCQMCNEKKECYKYKQSIGEKEEE